MENVIEKNLTESNQPFESLDESIQPEVLEGQSDWEHNLAKLVELKEIVEEKPTMVVNGQIQEVAEVRYFALVCPVCGDILYSYPPGYPEAPIMISMSDPEVVQALIDHVAEYCPKCGQKLSYKREII